MVVDVDVIFVEAYVLDVEPTFSIPHQKMPGGQLLCLYPQAFGLSRYRG